ALWSPDEGRYAEIPREMVASGDWVTPRLDGVKYFEKPPLVYWLEAAAIRLFGVHEWALRLWLALFALAGCLPVYAPRRPPLRRPPRPSRRRRPPHLAPLLRPVAGDPPRHAGLGPHDRDPPRHAPRPRVAARRRPPRAPLDRLRLRRARHPDQGAHRVP